MRRSPIGSLRVRVFFFGVGYCARRLIQRQPWIEASGTARTAESAAALRRDGVEAYQFDGAEAEDVGLTVHPHPTLSETFAMSAEAFAGTLTDLYIPKKK